MMEAIKGRRSIRKYKTDPVPEETLQAILEAVQWAPSWANTQCWEVIIVKDSKIRSELAATLPKGNPAIPSMTAAPLTLVLCGRKGVSGYYRGEVTTDKGDWFMYDVGVAMQNLCLAAWGLGLGTVHVGLMDAVKAQEILAVPAGTRVVALTPLGYPTVVGGSPPRKEIKDFVWHEKYGGK